MPTMYEIYEKHADRYDAMVRAEDYQGNLKSLLDSQLNWESSTVLEAGVGTGRVTQIYAHKVISAVCCDRSDHMLGFARQSLIQHQDKLEFLRADNVQFPILEQTFDIFIEGWSFGHSIMDCDSETEVEKTAELLVNNAQKNIRPGGKVVFIETLGTNVEKAQAPTDKLSQFYSLLEQTYQFAHYPIRTDLKYDSVEDAVYHMGFFFGPDMADRIKKRGTHIVPEWTGVWIKTV